MSLNFVGSPDFVDRSLPRHSTLGARRSRAGSRASSLDHRLSIIEEDTNNAPPAPPPAHRPHHRPFSRKFLGEPPRYKDGKEPPKYSLWDVTGPKGEKFEDLRNNAYVARRGGWKRICLITLLVIACVVALIVGLVVGLRKNHPSSTAPPPSPSSSSSPSVGPFPAGSYTFETFLDTSSTNCTSNAASWTCEPVDTYATSPTLSMATFNWIISAPGPSSSSNFTISSSEDPFAIAFSNATLSLLDAGSAEERYTFTTTFQRFVFPTGGVQCFYNNTQFTASMYTKKPKSYPSNSTNGSTTSSAAPAAVTSGGPAGAPAGGSFVNWNFAVDALQSIGGGVDVPACYNTNNGQIGSRVTSGITAQPAENFCSCAYKNYDP